MKKSIMFLMMFSLLAFYSYSQNSQSKHFNSVKVIETNKLTGLPSFVIFKERTLNIGDLDQWIKTNYNTDEKIQYKLIRTETDYIGCKHFFYNQTYNGIVIHDAVFIVHTRNGYIESINGTLYSDLKISNSFNISEQEGLQFALAKINAEQYKWEIPSEEQFIKKFKKNESATFYPTGEKEIININNKYLLCYKYDIYSSIPLRRAEYFIDASNGNNVFVNDLLQSTDVSGTAVTKYSGTRNIVTDSYGGYYRLRESGRGLGIETYDMNSDTDYDYADDFTDADNNWNNVNAEFDEVATDAHWGTEMTYDFFYSKFGRNSIDDSGFKLLSYVHYDYYYANAFWDGYRMTYGDGDGGTMAPLTALDIIGHEISHGLTTNTADLDYSYESGALNEGFSDIFGTAIEFYAKPGTANWTMGEDIGEIVRSLQNPNAYGLPDTYLGDYWMTGSSDNGGVHTNCGVLGFWFYLCSAGGSGVNDNGNSYTVVSIGMEKAAAISYRMLTVYLTNTSQYSDARIYAIQSATDLYGSCSPEVESVTNAMYAVGIGAQYSSSVLANFSASSTYNCNFPASISFYNNSVNGSSYLWDFGDGATSTLSNPSHTYATPGTYSVSLVTTGSALCGDDIDTLLLTDYITISNSSGPVTPYCEPQTMSSDTYGMGIYNFTLGTISNTTIGSEDGYQDYTCSFATDLIEGNSYAVSVVTGSEYPENVKIWIDYNADGNFNNTSEQVFVSNEMTQYHTGNIYVESGIFLDSIIRLRVGSDYYTYELTDACAETEYGQYEDYSVRLRENTFPPDVDFEANYITIGTGQTITFTDLTQNIPTGWQWEFVGGTPSVSSLQNPTVTYNTLGVFPVKLVASNSYGIDSLTKSSYINVSNVFSLCSGIDSTTAISGILYDSGGVSGNYGYNESCSMLIDPSCAISINFTLDYLNMPTSYDRLRVYNGTTNAGTLLLDSYLVSTPTTVTATSGAIYIEFYSNGSNNYAGFSASWNSVLPTNTPVADFIISDVNPPLNSPVEFTDQTSNYPGLWVWDFGDGTNSYVQNPTHYFMTPGFKTISLISDNCFSSDTVSYSLTVQDTAVITINPDSIYATINICNDSVSFPLTIYNTGAGDLDFSLSSEGTASSSTIELLALTYGVDIDEEYVHTLNAINQYYTDYNLTAINTTNAVSLQTALIGKDVLLIAEQEVGSSTIFTGFATVLQDFVSDGGTVIFCGTSNFGCIYNTGLFSGTGYTSLSGNTLSVLDNTHPITYGFPATITGQNATLALSISNTDAVKLVRNGTSDIVAFREVGLGKVIFIAYDYYAYDNYAAQIIANAVEWSGTVSLADWIELSSDSGIVPIADSVVIDVTINSQGMNSGIYNSELVINSSDPLNTSITVPVILTLIGSPEIILSETCINFGSTMEFTNTEDSICVYNTGCDTLELTSITNTLSEFTTSFDLTYLLPGDSTFLYVNFNPQTVSTFQDTILIYNNDTIAEICLLGSSYSAPSIIVNPESFDVNLSACGDSVTLELSIENVGGSNLDFSILGAGSGSGSSVELLALTYGVDLDDEYVKTFEAINQYYTDYNLTEINTSSAATLQTALVGKDVLLIAEQEIGVATVFTGFATVLQEFVSNGGTVIFCGTTTYSCIYNTGLFSGTGYYSATGNVLNVQDNTHPITEGLPATISGQNGTYLLTITNSDAVKLVKYSTYDAVAFREIGSGKAIFIAYDYYDYDDYAAQIIANAVEWGGLGGSYNWIHLSEISGSVVPSESQTIDVTFSSEGLEGGEYVGEIIVNSNDPLNPQIAIPCTLNVSYEPCGDFEFGIPNICSGQVNFIDKSLNNPLTWLWDFGDGSPTSSETNPSHIYSTIGEYEVQLIVCNAISCDTISYNVSIVNTSGPIAATCTVGSVYSYTSYGISKVSLNTINNISAADLSGYQDYTCTSSTSLTQGLVYPLSIETLGSYNKNINVWIDFNNNGSFETDELVYDTLNSASPHSGNILIPSTAVLNMPLRMRVACERYSYSAPQACVNVYYGEFEDYTVFLQPNTLPPDALYNHNVLDLCQGAFQFIDNSLNFPTSWYWDFGDGVTSSYQNPYHTYSIAGIYTVTLTTSNSFGTDVHSSQITVNSLNPDILLTGPQVINNTIQFSTSSIGVLSWQWDFGDGSTSSLAVPSHIYTVSDNYTITLDVQNGVGCLAHAFLDVFIDSQVYVESLDFDNIEIFPNPARDILNIENNSQYNYFKIEIISVNGQIVKNAVLDNKLSTIDINDLNPGIYFVNIYNDEAKFVRKLTIMK